MGRKPPQVEPPQWAEPELAGETLEVDVRVITPMFGGGFEAREVDADCPVRSAAVRGHLRFWWRATAGAAFTDSEELFEAEEAIWGSARRPGSVSLGVETLSAGELVRCAHFEWDGRRGKYGSLPRFEQGWPPYALQPFQGQLAGDGTKVEREPGDALRNVRFRVSLRAPEALRQPLSASLGAWLRYGGVGARTRRGCGSLSASFPTPGPSEKAQGEAMVSLLGGAQLVWGPEEPTALRAWNAAVTVYRDFRQKVGLARKPGREPNRPGRSRWPEADAVRRMTGRYTADHAPEHPAGIAFPRADLGLPIIFHFMTRGDPPEATLQGATNGRRRMGSPVITKAVETAADSYRPLILVLHTPHVWALPESRLEWKDGSRPVSRSITRENLDLSAEARRQVSPMGELGVREAFLAYAASQWRSAVEEMS